MKMKYLFFIPTPRNIPEFRKPVVDLLYSRFDVIWFKYYPEIEAYTKARNYFLKSPKNYEYFVILPDDLILNENGLNTLINELENPSLDMVEWGGHYPVLAGCCNMSYINQNEYEKIAAKQIVVQPTKNPRDRSILFPNFITRTDLNMLPNDIIQCMWIGFSCEFIARPVLESIPFRGLDTHGYPSGGIDQFFSEDLESIGVPQFIHRKAFFTHLKGLSVQYKKSISTNPDVIYVKRYKKFIKFRSADKAINKVL